MAVPVGVSGLPPLIALRKNGWTLAEFAGDRTPDGMQRLLNAAVWDDHEARDGLIGYVAAELGDPGRVLIADETGLLKSGEAVGGRAASVHRHGREDHQLPGRGVPGLRGAGARHAGAD